MPVVVKKPEKVKAGGAKGHYCGEVLERRQAAIVMNYSSRIALEST